MNCDEGERKTRWGGWPRRKARFRKVQKKQLNLLLNIPSDFKRDSRSQKLHPEKNTTYNDAAAWRTGGRMYSNQGFFSVL